MASLLCYLWRCKFFVGAIHKPSPCKLCLQRGEWGPLAVDEVFSPVGVSPISGRIVIRPYRDRCNHPFPQQTSLCQQHNGVNPFLTLSPQIGHVFRSAPPHSPIWILGK